MKKKKMIFIILGVVLVAAITTISIQLNRYKDVFTHNVVINGYDMSLCTKASTIERLTSLLDYNIIVKDDISEQTITLNSFSNLSIDNKSIDKIFTKTNPFIYMVLGNNLGETEFSTAQDYFVDKKSLKEQLQPLNDTRELGEDAYIYYDETLGEFTIKDDTLGSKLDIDMLTDMIYDDMMKEFEFGKKEYIFVIPRECYIPANITSDSLRVDKDKINETLNKDAFELDFYGNIETIDIPTLLSWSKKDDNGLPQIEDNHIVYDENIIKQNVKEYADKYNSKSTGLTFTNHAGKEITIDDDTFGWRIDEEKTLDNILVHLRCKEKEVEEDNNEVDNENIDTNDVSVEYLAYGFQNNEMPDTYIEVDVDEQHMYYFKENELVFDSDVVTGTLNSRDTNKGVEQILNKGQNVTLMNDAFSYYWMAINYDGEGFHDATWRSSFGGEIYKTNGSHGCVNMPLDKIKELYEITEVGTPVLVY